MAMGLILKAELETFTGQTFTDEKDVNLCNLLREQVSDWLETRLGRQLQKAARLDVFVNRAGRDLFARNPPMDRNQPVTLTDGDGKDIPVSVLNMVTGRCRVHEGTLSPDGVYNLSYTGGFDPLPDALKYILLRQTAIAIRESRNQDWGVSRVDQDTALGGGLQKQFDSSLTILERNILSSYQLQY